MIDAACKAKHGPGDTYRAWEHTKLCNESMSRTVKKNKRFSEVEKDIEPIRENQQ